MPDSQYNLRAETKRAKKENDNILYNVLSDEYSNSLPEQTMPAIDFRNVGGGEPVSNYSDYIDDPSGVSSWADINKMRANAQTGTEQFGNIFKRAPFNIGLGIIGNLAAIADVEDIFNVDDEIGNPISNLMAQAQEGIREKFPIYQENPDEPFDFSDSGYIFSNASQLLDSAGAFAGTALITGGILGGITKALTSESTIARLSAKYLPKAMKMAEEGKIAATAIEATKDALVAGSLNKYNVIINAFAGNQAESIQEATGVYDTVLKKQIAKGANYEDAVKRASESANVDMNINRINFLSNLTSAGAFTGASKYIRNNLFKNPLVELGVESGQEAIEEGVNYIAQREGEIKGDTGDSYDVNVGRYLSHLGEPRGLEAMMLGAAGGAAQTAIGHATGGITDKLTSVVSKVKQGIGDSKDAKKTKQDAVDPTIPPPPAPSKKTVVAKSNIDAVTNFINGKNTSPEAEKSVLNEIGLNNLHVDLGSSPQGSPTFKNIDSHIKAFEAMESIYDNEIKSQEKTPTPDNTVIQDYKERKDKARLAIDHLNSLKEYANNTPEAIGAQNAKEILLTKMQKEESDAKVNNLNAELNKLNDAKILEQSNVDEKTGVADQSKITIIDDKIKEIKKEIKKEKTNNTKIAKAFTLIASPEYQNTLKEKARKIAEDEEALRKASAVSTASGSVASVASLDPKQNTNSNIPKLDIHGGTSIVDKYGKGEAMFPVTTNKIEQADIDAGFNRNTNDDEIRVVKSGNNYISIENVPGTKDSIKVTDIEKKGLIKKIATDDDVIINALHKSNQSQVIKDGVVQVPRKKILFGDQVIDPNNLVSDKLEEIEKERQAIVALNISAEERTIKLKEFNSTIVDRVRSGVKSIIGDTPLAEYLGLKSVKSNEIISEEEDQLITAKTAAAPIVPSVKVNMVPKATQMPDGSTTIELVPEEESVDEDKTKESTPKGKRYTPQSTLGDRSEVLAINHLNEAYSFTEQDGKTDLGIIGEYNINNSPEHTKVGDEVILSVPNEYKTYRRGKDGKVVRNSAGEAIVDTKRISDELRDGTKTIDEIAQEIPIEIRHASDGSLRGYVQTMSWTSEKLDYVPAGSNHNYAHFSKTSVSVSEINEARAILMEVRRAMLEEFIKTGKSSVKTKITSISYGVVNKAGVDDVVSNVLGDLEKDNEMTLGAPYMFGVMSGNMVQVPTDSGTMDLFESERIISSPLVVFQGANGQPMFHEVLSYPITPESSVISYIRDAFYAFKSDKLSNALVEHFLSKDKIEYSPDGKISSRSKNEAFRNYIQQFVRLSDKKSKVYSEYKNGLLAFNIGGISIDETMLNNNKKVGDKTISEDDDRKFNSNIEMIVSAIANAKFRMNFDMKQLNENKPIISVSKDGIISQISPSVREYYKSTTTTNLRPTGKVKVGSKDVNLYVKQAVVGIDLKSIASNSDKALLDNDKTTSLNENEVVVSPENSSIEKEGEEALKICTGTPAKVKRRIPKKVDYK